MVFEPQTFKFFTNDHPKFLVKNDQRKMNINIKSLTNQAKNQKRTRNNKLRSINPQPLVEIIESPEEFLRSLPKIYRTVLNALIKMNYSFKGSIYSSQTYIAQLTGITRTHVNSIIKHLEYFGLISTKYRHMRTCLYKISSYFDNPFIRSRLGHLLRALLAGLFVFLTQHKIQGNKDYNLYKKEIVFDQRTTKKGAFMDPGSILAPLAAKIYGENNPISPKIRELTYLNLTKWGQIKLSAFPDEAIESADYCYKHYKGTVDNPFNFFFKLCFEYMAANQIKPNWQLVNQLSAAYNMPSDAKMVLNPVQKQEYGEKLPKAKHSFSANKPSFYAKKEIPTVRIPVNKTWNARTDFDKQAEFNKANQLVQQTKNERSDQFNMFWDLLNKKDISNQNED